MRGCIPESRRAFAIEPGADQSFFLFTALALTESAIINGLMQPARRFAANLFHLLGGVQAVRFRRRNELRILMYHRFRSDRVDGMDRMFERQCEHVRNNYHPLPLTKAAQLLANEGELPRNSLVITVDDGHRDFYTVAYPILRKYDLTATAYLTTDYVDGKCWLWFDQVDYIFAHTACTSLRLDVLGGREWSFKTKAERDQSCEDVKLTAITLHNTTRIELLTVLPKLLRVDVPALPPEPWEALRWPEIREMAAAGFEFGGHTLTHPILSHLESDANLREEIQGSKRRIEQELQTEVLHFCYPNGSDEDISESAVAEVRAAGFRTAVTAKPGLNAKGAPLYRLKRVPVDPSQLRDYFIRTTAGYRLS